MTLLLLGGEWLWATGLQGLKKDRKSPLCSVYNKDRVVMRSPRK